MLASDIMNDKIIYIPSADKIEIVLCVADSLAHTFNVKFNDNCCFYEEILDLFTSISHIRISSL